VTTIRLTTTVQAWNRITATVIHGSNTTGMTNPKFATSGSAMSASRSSVPAPAAALYAMRRDPLGFFQLALEQGDIA